MAQTESRILITPPFRMSYANLVEARAYQENGRDKGTPQYSVEMILDPDDLISFKEFSDEREDFDDISIMLVLAQCAKAEWPEMNVKEAVAQGGLSWPIKDGDAEAERRKGDQDALKGKKLIRIKTNEDIEPPLYYREDGKRKAIPRGTDDGDRKAKRLFASGNYAFAEIVVKAGTSGNNKYVTCYLGSICYTKDGDKIGSPRLMDRFDGVMGGESDHNPTEGLDDEIPM